MLRSRSISCEEQEVSALCLGKSKGRRRLTTLIMGSIADQPLAAHTLTSANDLTTALCCSKTSGMQIPENTEREGISEARRGSNETERLTGVGEDALANVGDFVDLVARNLGDRMHVAGGQDGSVSPSARIRVNRLTRTCPRGRRDGDATVSRSSFRS